MSNPIRLHRFALSGHCHRVELMLSLLQRPCELVDVNLPAAALWTRSKSDITDAEYQDFYKQLSYDSEAPLAYTHNRVEGRTEYTQLLYVPAKAPFDLWNRDKRGGWVDT